MSQINSEIAAFSTTIPPPPPYPGSEGTMPIDPSYDLTPTAHIHNRPRLPDDKRNPHLSNLPEDVNIVKFQTIVREEREIVVGRIKVPTPGRTPHAFILRRYDTNAISLTTMYKVAFPGATEEDEKREMEWVKSSYDTRNTNGGRGCEAVRLAGQWVSRHLAIHLAPAYGISELVAALARAVPDPNVAYRKSQRSQAASDELARARPISVVPNFSPADATTAAPAPKRQRVSETGSAMEVDNSQRHFTLEATTTISGPATATVDMNTEIEQSRQLVSDLRREMQLRAAAGQTLEDQGLVAGEGSRGVKRGQGEGDAVYLAGGSGAGKERVIKVNKRVEQGGAVETAKTVAKAGLIFGLGMAATSVGTQVLPHVMSYFGF